MKQSESQLVLRFVIALARIHFANNLHKPIAEFTLNAKNDHPEPQ